MKKNSGGKIINISSFVVKYGMGRNNSIQYAATKSTLETLTTGLSRLGAAEGPAAAVSIAASAGPSGSAGRGAGVL